MLRRQWYIHIIVFFLFYRYCDCMKTETTWLSRHITLHDYADARDERENAITHAVGVIAGIIFLILVIVERKRFLQGNVYLGMIIYAATLLLLYSSSTIYHHVPKGDMKRLFRVLDHANIYLLIAGTYTPILTYIGTPTAMRLLVITWGVALVGILFSLLFWERLKVLHILFYLGMGWMILFFWDEIVPVIPAQLLWWIIAAGLTYSIGVIFYSMKKLAHNHMIWHLFCVVASALFCIGFMLHLSL